MSVLHALFSIFKLLFIFAALTKVYEKANSVVSSDVQCPNWLHKYIIGKKGAKLHNLMGDLQKLVRSLIFFSPTEICKDDIFMHVNWKVQLYRVLLCFCTTNDANFISIPEVALILSLFSFSPSQ